MMGLLPRVDTELCGLLPEQVVVNYVAMTPEGRIFDNSLAKNAPYFIRVGTGQVTITQQHQSCATS